nr:hypothetical protein [Edwardsiella piscicida]
MLLGSTGTGKSTLLMMFQHLMQKYRRPESFAPGATKKRFTSVVFDKDRSAEMSIRLQGGSYFRFRSGEKTGLNPFALAPTKRNRNFLKKLMRMMCTRDGKPLDRAMKNASARQWTPSCWTTRLSFVATASPACWKCCMKPDEGRTDERAAHPSPAVGAGRGVWLGV